MLHHNLESETTQAGSLQPDVRLATFEKIGRELDRAYAKHGREQWGRHEFYAILREEVDELWDAVKADEPQDRVRDEAIQVAAMVFRYLETGDKHRELNADISHQPSTTKNV